MLKAIVSYSKKIPVPDSEYSSQGYSLSLETELPDTDPRAIQARLHDTFALVRASVEQELANGHCPAKPGGSDTERLRGPGTSSPNAPAKASNRQIKYLTDLATQRGISLSELNAELRGKYGVAGLYDLDRKQASEVLDALKRRKPAA